MTRAAKAALDAYPMLFSEREGYESDMANRRGLFIIGYLQAEKDLGWHSVEESLPEVGEEVIVLTQVPAFGRISFAHLVNSDTMITIDGKPYKPEAYSGWNIPSVKFWMPFPELPEKRK